MSKVTVTLKSGEVRVYEDGTRPGGSYSNVVRYEGAFVIVEDQWGERTAFPAADVVQVVIQPPPGRW